MDIFMNNTKCMKIIMLCMFSILSYSCKKEIEDPFAIPKSMNLGYLFDSLEYEIERPWFTCDGNHDSIGRESWHSCFCRLNGYIPYKELKFAGESMDILKKVVRNIAIHFLHIMDIAPLSLTVYNGNL